MRGIHADERVCGLYEMHTFLSGQVNFDKFPFTHNRYVNGMPIQTYEAILQNISTCIQLYNFATGGTYNTKSISTLLNESFFFRFGVTRQGKSWVSKGLQYSSCYGTGSNAKLL